MSHTEDATLSGSYAWTDTLKGVHYGPGSVKTALPKLLKIVGGSKVLILTGKSLREKVIQTLIVALFNSDIFPDRCHLKHRNTAQRLEFIRSHFL